MSVKILSCPGRIIQRLSQVYLIYFYIVSPLYLISAQSTLLFTTISLVQLVGKLLVWFLVWSVHMSSDLGHQHPCWSTIICAAVQSTSSPRGLISVLKWQWESFTCLFGGIKLWFLVAQSFPQTSWTGPKTSGPPDVLLWVIYLISFTPLLLSDTWKLYQFEWVQFCT